MCAPLAAVAAATAVASAATSMYASKQQTKAQNRQAEAEMKNAEYTQIANQNALDEQANQIAQKGADEKLIRERDGLRERAAMRVLSGNIAGNSIDRLFATSQLNENYDKGTIDNNTFNGLSQNLRAQESERVAAGARYRNAQSKWAGNGNSSMLINGFNSGMQGFASGYSLGNMMFSTNSSMKFPSYLKGK